jgi:phage shock protein A
MGIFTRFRDIVSSNINAMLDRAEDPEKLLKLMIREMEDTLVELKASCAGVMADGKKTERNIDELAARLKAWEDKATLAVRNGRDDLAREALIRKRLFSERRKERQQNREALGLLVEQYHEDIHELEGRLKSARDKQRLLVQRHVHARRKMDAQHEIRRADSTEVMIKFEEFEKRIDRMESEADLINIGRPNTLEEELDKFTADAEIEAELQALKTRSEGGNEPDHK